MKNYLKALINNIEFHLITRYFITHTKNISKGLEIFLIFPIAQFLLSLIISIITKNLSSIVIASIFLFFSMFFIWLTLANAKNLGEELSEKIKEYSILSNEFTKQLQTSITKIISLSLFSTTLFFLPHLTSIIFTYKTHNTLTLIVLFSYLIATLLTTIITIAHFLKPKQNQSLSIEEHRTIQKTTIAKKILAKSISFKIKNFFNEVLFSHNISQHINKNKTIFIGFIIALIVAFLTSYLTYASFMFCISTAIIGGLFGARHYFERFNQHQREANRPFIFAQTIFVITFILASISRFRLTIIKDETSILYAFRDMINPIAETFNTIMIFFQHISQSNLILLPLIAITIFVALYFLSLLSYRLIHSLEDISDAALKKELTNEQGALIFGDNLSSYPSIMRAALSALGLLLLYVELPFLSTMIYNLIATLQVEEVFKISLFSQSNITMFFNIIFIISLVYITLQITLDFLSSIFSHIMLLSDEVIFVKNYLIKKTMTRIPIQRINHIHIQQNIIEKFLDIGTIILESSDTSNRMIVKGVTSIHEKNRKIMDKIKIDLQKNNHN